MSPEFLSLSQGSGEVVQRNGVAIRVVDVVEWLLGLEEGKEPDVDTAYVKNRGDVPSFPAAGGSD